jgi:hypothetical protein
VVSQSRPPAPELAQSDLPTGGGRHDREEEQCRCRAGSPKPTWPRPTKLTSPQQGRGVEYKRYWVDEKAGKIFCLVEAPDADSAHAVHRDAHGLVADEIYEVSEHT